MVEHVVRFGLLGAARIAPRALVEPAMTLDGVRVTRVAARDVARARAFALDHGIPGVSAGYAELLAADDVDVVYIALPNALHAPWALAALRAGKHVLCEKPLASNAVEAAELVAVAEAEGRCLGEAFHDRYHPMWTRILEVVASGVLGPIGRVEAAFDARIAPGDIRWDLALGGGAMMDLGCYAVSWVRRVMGEEPSVVWAEAVEEPAGIDAEMRAELQFPSGATGSVACSMRSERRAQLRVVGGDGMLEADNPLSPQRGNSLLVETAGGRTTGSVDAGVSYRHMLRAFADHVTHGTPFPTAGADAVANMAAIDAIYTVAGLGLRGG